MSDAGPHPNTLIRIDSPYDVVILEPYNPTLEGVKWTAAQAICHVFTNAD